MHTKIRIRVTISDDVAGTAEQVFEHDRYIETLGLPISPTAKYAVTDVLELIRERLNGSVDGVIKGMLHEHITRGLEKLGKTP